MKALASTFLNHLTVEILLLNEAHLTTIAQLSSNSLLKDVRYLALYYFVIELSFRKKYFSVPGTKKNSQRPSYLEIGQKIERDLALTKLLLLNRIAVVRVYQSRKYIRVYE